MRALVCLLLFLALTFEGSDFAYGYWNTVMVYARPLFQGNPVNMWDVSLGLVALAVALRPGTWRAQVRPLNRALFASLAMLLVMVVWGRLRGGDLREAYFQLGPILRMFFIVPILIGLFRSRRDLRLMAGTVLAAAVYRAIACIVCLHLVYLANGGIEPWPEYVTDHHDSALWVAAVLGLSSWLLVRPRVRTFLVVGSLVPLLLMAIYHNQRRLAWLELAGGLALTYLMIPRGRLRRKLNRLVLAVAPLLVLYVCLGWGRSGALFAPVNKIRSAVADDKNDSNRARDLENMGLVLTLQGNRLLGTGLGQQYEEVSTVYTLRMSRTFPSYRYVPHNSVLGLVAFTGLAGFPVIWAFMSVGAFLAARARAFAWHPSEQALSMVAFAFLFVYGMQAFGDMGFVSLKVNLLLACALATAARLAALTGAWPLRRTSPSGVAASARRVPRSLVPAALPAAAPAQTP
jgi:hypothetical protein